MGKGVIAVTVLVSLGIGILLGGIGVYCIWPHVQPEPHVTETYREARCDMASTVSVTGTIYLKQNVSQDLIITGEIRGLTGESHGFHIHQYSSLDKNCTAAGGHFNPHNEPHGAPNSTLRHVGDLGNVEAHSGVAFVNIEDSKASLFGDFTIVGRAIVVHTTKDDFSTQPTGNAGGRLACCNIVITE